MKNEKRIFVILYLETGEEIDLDLPSKITVEELLEGLNEGLRWKIAAEDIRDCYLRSENPIAFLKGNHSLEEYHLRNGSALFFSVPQQEKRKR